MSKKNTIQELVDRYGARPYVVRDGRVLICNQFLADRADRFDYYCNLFEEKLGCESLTFVRTSDMYTIAKPRAQQKRRTPPASPSLDVRNNVRCTLEKI